MKVLVTGGSGFLGRHVLTSLLSHGHEVVTLGRSAPIGFAGVRHIQADLLHTLDPVPLLQLAEASHLLHLAWTTEHGKYWSSPLNFQWVQATLRLVDAFCLQGGTRVVVAGTCAEYDWAHGYLREDATPCSPTTTYGVAKNATRQMIEALCELHGTSFAWGRIFFPFGQGEAAQRLIPSLLRVFRGEAPPFGVNANAFRDMLYVPDVAKAFLTLLSHTNQGSFNICSGQPVQIEQVVRFLADVCRADPRQVLDLATQRPGEPHMLTGENAKLIATGWQPNWTLEQGLAAVAKEHR
ncbi:MAG: NAD(P)-dependent oxidoreductase [Formivibrio sp.]|nr:NAD(P)-dependent oxidoreductase [Formivibrio sp.]